MLGSDQLSRVAVLSAFLLPTIDIGVQQPSVLDSTRVLVSRTEVRVLFPAETTQRWGWPRRSAGGNSASYSWIGAVDLFDGPRWLELDVWQTDDRERSFASLADVVAAGRAQLCRPSTVQRCLDIGLRADVARQRRQYQASINRISRSIGARYMIGDSTIVLEVGDSTSLNINETHCSFDACGGFTVGIPDSNWKLGDPAMAVIRRPGPVKSGGMIVYSSGPPYLVARKTGTTILQARDIHASADTMPSREPVPTSLQIQLRVIPRLARVEIQPRPDTVRGGETVEFRTRAIDRAGREVTGLPAEWRIQARRYPETGMQLVRSVRFDSTGTTLVVARVAGRTDSLTVVVVPPRRR